MISRLAVNGSTPGPHEESTCDLHPLPFESFAVRNGCKSSPSLVSLKSIAALVLFGLSFPILRAQQPQSWPQDDIYDDQQPQAGYGQPNNYPQQGYPQGDPQQGYAQQYPQPSYGQPQDYAPSQGMDAAQLEQLAAPIAIYPDGLLAQVLAASTYPAQVAAADQWLRSMGNAPPDQIAAAANAQTGWDPSVKALTAYPQILAMMNQNLQWTTALGNAYYNQPQDLLQTVQVLRQRAEAAGNLQNTPQEQITDNQGYIALAPANPEMVYVPTYNPWAVYGEPIAAYPGYEPIDTVGAMVGSAVQYGLSFAVGAFLHSPFGLMNWGLDWFGHSVLFNHNAWCSRSVSVADWGFPHGGPRAFRGGEFARYGDRGYGARYGRGGWNSSRDVQGFNRSGGRFPSARPVTGYGNGSQGGFNRGNYPVARPGQGYLGGPNRGYAGYGAPGRSVVPRQDAYNRMPTARPQPYQGTPQGFAGRGQGYGYGSQPSVRPQPYSGNGAHSVLGSGSYPRTPSYGGGRSYAYSAPSQAYRVPSSGFSQGFSQPRGSSFSGQSGRSGGGFHMFGGGHSSSPSFGGGHSFGGSGGGHSSFSGGAHSSGGGGGHSFGGGGHSGGGHSGGGHHR